MRPTALLRLLRLAAHVAAGVLTILLLFPHLRAEERNRRVVAWARRLLDILHVRLSVSGRPPAVRGEGALIVANHVSWLDIHLLHSLLPTRFVSKAEVREWPVIGWLSSAAGTLYLERTKKSDAHRVHGEMADLLKSGECLALFPEGTTTDGTRLLGFHATLFQPAVSAGARVWPALIRYRRADGQIDTDVAYCDDISLGQSLRKVVGQDEIHAEVRFLAPIAAAGLHRKELARQAEAAIRAALADAGRGSRPGSVAHPPAAGR